MWKPGDVIVWRGIYRERVWHAIPTTVVKDTPQEIVLFLMPGTNCMLEENYAKGKNNGKRRWDFKYEDWKLENYIWHTNHLLVILEPEKYYATIYFWEHKSNKFIGYYINFQLPFKRRRNSLDTLDLDLDIVIHPDFFYEWKDIEDYQKGIETGIILPEWASEIEGAKIEVVDKLERREYPFDNSWVNWQPDPSGSLPKLPPDWDKI